MIGHKTSLNKFKEIEIISSIFLDHNCLKLETNLKEKTQKHSNTWRLNNIFLNNEWVNNEIKEENKKYLETNENEHTTTQTHGYREGSPEREVHRNACLPRKNRYISNKQPNPTSTRTRGTTTKPRVSGRKEGRSEQN